MTFPFGKFKNYGFFQQFDKEMVDRVSELLVNRGELKIDYIEYKKEGWVFSSQDKCNEILSFNPHTGEDKGEDGAAHSRCVCVIDFIKA